MFQLNLMIKLSFMEIFHIVAKMFSKSSAAVLLYVEKGLMTAVLIVISPSVDSCYVYVS